MYLSRRQRKNNESPQDAITESVCLFSNALVVAGASRYQEVPGLLDALPKILPDQGPKVTSTYRG